MAIVDDTASTLVDLQRDAAAPNIVKFQLNAAQVFIVNQNWDGLEAYLAEFFAEIQGKKFFFHPGLFCSLYQAQISDLIGKKLFVEARAVFDEKVEPLLDQVKDDLYKPFDLEDRVGMLRHYVNICLPPPADEVEDMHVVLSDYMMLYFPTSLLGEVNRTNSISDFVMTFNDEKGKHHRCLACQWVMPVSATSMSIVHHIKHSKQVNQCRRVTKWMLGYLAYVNGEKEVDIQGMTASSMTQSRKRKALSPPLTPPILDQQSVVIPVELALQIYSDLCTNNLLALSALKNDNTLWAAEAKEILLRQEKVISELKGLFVSSMQKHAPLGSTLAFMKIRTLCDLSDDLFTLLKNLPNVSELLLKQDNKVNELRRCFMVAAAERLPPTAPADKGRAGAGSTSPSTSSESISSKLRPLGPV
ncbi:unnamed protein product [Urochloa decumbens]|uniref:Uncharacterized protein n=1 Tax=Urochloa decumbens TaxID=240449 RepID=A0ABC9A7E8_9POAL